MDSKNQQIIRQKYYNFLDHELPEAISEGLNTCFDEADTDPEVVWKLFREGLRKIKKRHVELYREYMETDDDLEAPESDMAKLRKNKIKK